MEKRKLTYLGGVAKNRKVVIKETSDISRELTLKDLAKSLPEECFKPVTLELEKRKTVWVAIVRARASHQQKERTFAIVMNASSFEEATDIDYFITNVKADKVTAEWLVTTYSQRNWVEVFYREAKGWLGLREYQVRDKRSLLRHFILVFCAYSFILWHPPLLPPQWGGLWGGRRWANRPLNTFTDALEAFRTAMSFRFFDWLTTNRDVFAAYKASLGFIWA